MKDMPGYGLNAPIVEGIKYQFHDDDVFKEYYKSRTENGVRSRHPHLRDDRPSRMRTADALTVNPSATLGNMRFKAFFDQGACPGSDCGHCTAAGQTVQTFEGAATTTCGADDVLTDAKKSYIMDTLMPRAMNFLSSALRINPVVGNLVVSGGKCGNPGTPVPAAHSTTGVADADFTIYVTAAPKSDPNVLTVAWALSCRRDGANRPVTAHVNFVPRRLSNAAALDPVEIQSDLLTAIHEISHALGFSSPFFDGTGYYDENYNFVAGGGLTTVAAAAPFNKERKFISSPRVVREVRAFFNCSTAIGGEIEDQGGSGTAGSHWEKRIYQQHAMAGIGSTIAASPSRMLLAYFEDYGHYVANYSALDEHKYFINFGRNKGCDFVNQRCDSTANKASGEYCFTTDSKISSCTYDGLAIGYCSASSFSTNLDSQFQYFPGQPTVGSSIQLDDFCPSIIFYSNRRCIAADTQPTGAGSGESFGSSSRCFQSNLVSWSASSSSSSLFGSSTSRPVSEQTRCFETRCNKDGTLSVIVDLRIVPCPQDGSAGNADTSGLGYSGEILCPPAERYCPRSATGVNGSMTYGRLPLLSPVTSNDVMNNPQAVESRPFAPAFNVPVPSSCAKRLPCAQAAYDRYMPSCREAAFEISRCFGTDCDPQMLSFIYSSLNLATNCTSQKESFAKYCTEGKVGANALCALAGAGKVAVFTVGMILMMMMMILIVVG